MAIADVSHYVREGTALDDEARDRGTSVYFPQRVVPMLPERISNDLCSLRANEDRAALARRTSLLAGNASFTAFAQDGEGGGHGASIQGNVATRRHAT